MEQQKKSCKSNSGPSRWSVGAATFVLVSLGGAGWVLAQQRVTDDHPPQLTVRNLEQATSSSHTAVAGGECIGDLTGSHQVGGADLGQLLACWGPVSPGGPCELADLTGSGSVDGADLGLLLANWGPCPAPSCDYQYDQAEPDAAVGWDSPAVLMWMHRFEVPEEVDLIWAVQSAFGDGVEADDPVGYAIYEVDGNGEPGNLLFADTCTVDENAAGTGNRQVFTVPGVPVEDEIFIAVYVEDPGDEFVVAPLDQSVTDQADNVWVAADEVGFADFDPGDPGLWTMAPTTLIDFNIEGVWAQCASGLETVTPGDADGFFFEIDNDEGETPGSRHFGRFIDRIWGEQARATGDLFVASGQTLSGTVVAENIHMESGGRVYVEPGTKIIATNRAWLGAALVPLPDEGSEVRRRDDRRGDDRALSQNWCGDCDSPTSKVGAKGDNASRIWFAFGEATIPDDQAFGDICAGDVGAGEDGEDVTVNGGPDENVRAVGGNGGAGADVILWGWVLNVEGVICNGVGGKGGDAVAQAGQQTDDCTCGCDAQAEGGRGGPAGRLLLSVNTLNFSSAGEVQFSPSGDGGQATATGSSGSPCPCGEAGGTQRGGWGDATGGNTWGPRRFCLSGQWNMPNDGGLNEFVAGHLNFPDGPTGGEANAEGGPGGDGLDCECGENGAEGGPGGNAEARAGHGERGYSAVGGPGATCRVMTVVMAAASDGGDGGDAKATAGFGGVGGSGTWCPCPHEGPAGDGGTGGLGGNANAHGGRGGRAFLRSAVAVPDGSIPVSGDGGDAEAECGDGEFGGYGADCAFDLDPESPCIAGEGGPGGAEGSSIVDGGDPGVALGIAVSGASGGETVISCFAGIAGDDGWNWCLDGPPESSQSGLPDSPPAGNSLR